MCMSDMGDLDSKIFLRQHDFWWRLGSWLARTASFIKKVLAGDWRLGFFRWGLFIYVRFRRDYLLDILYEPAKQLYLATLFYVDLHKLWESRLC